MMTGEQITGTILIDCGQRPTPMGTYMAGTTLAPASNGYSDGIYVEVDATGAIVYACHRDGDNGPRTWWFAGDGTTVDEASLAPVYQDRDGDVFEVRGDCLTGPVASL